MFGKLKKVISHWTLSKPTKVKFCWGQQICQRQFHVKHSMNLLLHVTHYGDGAARVNYCKAPSRS